MMLEQRAEAPKSGFWSVSGVHTALMVLAPPIGAAGYAAFTPETNASTLFLASPKSIVVLGSA
jgi:hypothetical protein